MAHTTKWEELAEVYIQIGDLVEAMTVYGYDLKSRRETNRRARDIRGNPRFHAAVRKACTKHLLVTAAQVSSGVLKAASLNAAQKMYKYYVGEEPTGLIYQNADDSGKSTINENWGE
jgi:hypothetical protein